jgi:hypothetical protein
VFDSQHGGAEAPGHRGRFVRRTVVDDDDFEAVGAVGIQPDAAQAGCQPDRVVSDGHHERDQRGHFRSSPNVHSGFIPDGSTLNSSYILGMLVNIRTMNITVQTIR